jgi:hypothetical protein
MQNTGQLDRLESKLQQIRDRTQGVAEGYATGFYLWGEGGTSKSFTVEATLKELGKPYKLSNSRVTGKGLFELLRDFPDGTHILEDVETLFGDKNALGVLRSALWGQTGDDGFQERLVTWHIGGHRQEFVFTGGIILVANCPPENVPQMRAIRTRLACLHYQPTTEEVTALMRQIASQGHRHGPYRLSPEECTEVAEEIINHSQRLGRPLDLRLLVNACQDRLQWANGASESHWRQLLDSRLKERVVSSDYQSRSARKSAEVAIARQIAHLPRPQRVAAWKKETGKSEPALYRRLKEVEATSPVVDGAQRWADN